jgi:ABC-type branched-subunit amino acid transport system substrate-binding protein
MVGKALVPIVTEQKGGGMKLKRTGAAVAFTAAVMMLAAACGSSSSSGSGSGGSSSSGAPIKIGVLTSITGSSASGFTPSTENGIKARLGLVNAKGGVNGHKITFVMADDASSAAGAATAVRQLIEQDHVTAIVDNSSWFFGAYSIAVQAGIPVFGTGFDGGPEWTNPQYKDLFDVQGSENYAAVSAVWGLVAKKLGVTKAGAVGYVGSPSAEISANNFMASVQHYGIAKGYVTNVPFGSTNVGPLVLGIKNSGTNGFYTVTIPNTSFAVLVGLAQAGVKMKMVLLPTGYGGDLLADKAAVQAGNGAYFYTLAAPVETGNAAAKQMQEALHTYAGIPSGTIPDFGEYQAWLATDALLAALQKAGPNPTSSSIVSGFRHATWNAGGLLPRSVNFGQYGTEASSTGPGGCLYIVRLLNGAFHPVQGLSPVCAGAIPGLTVSP